MIEKINEELTTVIMLGTIGLMIYVFVHSARKTDSVENYDGGISHAEL